MEDENRAAERGKGEDHPALDSGGRHGPVGYGVVVALGHELPVPIADFMVFVAAVFFHVGLFGFRPTVVSGGSMEPQWQRATS